MRHELAGNLLCLAIELQAALRRGLTIDDIQEKFSVSRRTAERMRDAVEAAFGPLELVEDADDRRRHWRLRSPILWRHIRVEPDEIAELEIAAEGLDRAGFAERAALHRGLATRLRAALCSLPSEALASELEALMQAEGLAMRAGPCERLQDGLLSLLREAIRTTRVVEFGYPARSAGRRRQRVLPFGVLYGNRAFLVGRADGADDTRLWRVSRMSDARLTGDGFERDPEFDLRRYAERSFGVFQEAPVKVVLRFDARAAPDAGAFRFHPGQKCTENGDGSLTVRFEAGGIEEMCWHLVTWGESVTVERPARLRRRLAEMCASLAAHHRA